MKLKVTQIRSTIGRNEKQRRTIAALGLGKIGRSRLHDDNPVIRGMINAVIHLLKVEEVEEKPVAKPSRKKVKKATEKTVQTESVPTAATEEQPIPQEPESTPVEAVQETAEKVNVEKNETALPKATPKKKAAVKKEESSAPAAENASEDTQQDKE